MAEILIYVTPVCPYCVRAKALFDTLGVAYTIIDVSKNDALRAEMVQKAGGRTSVPQIFINNHHIGGCDDLYALHASGQLDHHLNH